MVMDSPDHSRDIDGAGDERLQGFVADLRSLYAFGPPPQVGPRLSAVLTGGLGAAGQRADAPANSAERVPGRPVGGGDGPRWLAGWLQGRRTRIGLGAAVASLTLLGTGAAGALPGPAQSAFERTVGAVIDLPVPARPSEPSRSPATGPGTDPGRPDGAGPRGSTDAGGPPESLPLTPDRRERGVGVPTAPGGLPGSAGDRVPAGNGPPRTPSPAPPVDLPGPAAPPVDPGPPAERPGAGPAEVPGLGDGRDDEHDDDGRDGQASTGQPEAGGAVRPSAAARPVAAGVR